LAAKYLEHNVGIGNEEIKPRCQKLLIHLRNSIEPILNDYQVFDGWDDLRAWVKQVVMLPNQQTDTRSPDKFFEEFQRYKNAKKSGRGKTALCSISHSAYSVTEQMESAVLFTPQVYTNKQNLGGSNAKRNISSIAGIEFMLRQILMSETEAVGKNFEDAKYRYIYFYHGKRGAHENCDHIAYYISTFSSQNFAAYIEPIPIV
jgi:CRISPR-associated protein Csc3